MKSNGKRVEGIYFNSADTPAFLEGRAIGGHDYVYLEGFLRIPGHFVRVEDPKDNPDAPETFRVAYGKLMEKGQSAKQETHQAAPGRRANVVTNEEPEEEEEAEQKPAPKKPSRSARKGKSETTSADESSQ